MTSEARRPAPARTLTALLVATQLFAAPPALANYHLIGWSNLLLPGSGQAELGNYWLGAGQFAYEVGTFYLGIRLDNGPSFTLDGFVSSTPAGRLRLRSRELGWTNQLYGDMLQEFAIKSQMVNTFDAYRQAALLERGDGTLPPGIDDEPTLNLFLEPFMKRNLLDPWVYVPLVVVVGYTVADYLTSRGSAGPNARLTPYSNFLYTFNYGLWQPFGSGAPEEMFYRGFLQHEFLNWVPSPFLAVPLSAALFAFSHAPGDGRYSAGVAGLYLGMLAFKEDGRLGKGITVHFWADMILGVETILLNHYAQGTTPPATFTVQVNY